MFEYVVEKVSIQIFFPKLISRQFLNDPPENKWKSSQSNIFEKILRHVDPCPQNSANKVMLTCLFVCAYRVGEMY